MSTHSFAKLYVKDLKSIYKFFLVLLVLQVVYIFFLLDINLFHAFFPISETFVLSSHFAEILNFIMFVSIIIFPFLFLFSWFSEENNETHYQLLSLPGRIHTLMKSKMFAILTLGMIWILGIVIFILLMDILRQPLLGQRADIPLISRIHWFFYRYINYFGDLLILMGIAGIVIGFVQVIRRYRVLAGMAVFSTLCTVIFWKVIPLSHQILSRIFNFTIRDFTQSHRLWSLFMVSLFSNLSLIIVGLACMYIGFYLFERFSEV
ncbi:hypothetical protein ACFL6H_02765 [Candidatus Latescibacterota bacterium]